MMLPKFSAVDRKVKLEICPYAMHILVFSFVHSFGVRLSVRTAKTYVPVCRFCLFCVNRAIELFTSAQPGKLDYIEVFEWTNIQTVVVPQRSKGTDHILLTSSYNSTLTCYSKRS